MIDHDGQRMIDEMPLISVAMPVFNAGKYLRAAVVSILNQTEPHWELLLIDDGSTDNAVAELADIKDFRIRLIQDGRNVGLAARLNQAIDMARGRYLARMDQDDISHPERFSRQLELLQSRPEVDLVGSRCLTISEGGEITGVLPSPETHEQICRRPWLGFYFPHPTWMGRLEWFRRYRYACPGPYFCEDQELLLRTHDVSCFEVVPEYLLAYRLRDYINWKKARSTRMAWYRIQREYFSHNRMYLNTLLASLAVIVRLASDAVEVLRRKVPLLQAKQRSVKVSILAGDLKLWRNLIHLDGG